MPVLPFTTVALEGDVAAALAAVPARAGVGQILGPEGGNLVIGRAANLRRWAASHLGAGPPPRKGKRPQTDLRPVATAIAHGVTTSPFHQRLVFERLMARYVPIQARRDLRRPAYLHLDPEERFPRVTVRPTAGGRAGLFGPLRERRAAERAVKALHKLFPLRPCDFVFEPDPELPVGLGCVYAQVRSCAAPCLARVGEEAYRTLARQAVAFLGDPGARPVDAEAWLPPWVAPAQGLALVVEKGTEGLELYPVRAGVIAEDAATYADLAGIDAAVADLKWLPGLDAPDDTPWVSAWLHGPRKTGTLLAVPDLLDRHRLAARVREACQEW